MREKLSALICVTLHVLWHETRRTRIREPFKVIEKECVKCGRTLRPRWELL